MTTSMKGQRRLYLTFILDCIIHYTFIRAHVLGRDCKCTFQTSIRPRYRPSQYEPHITARVLPSFFPSNNFHSQKTFSTSIMTRVLWSTLDSTNHEVQSDTNVQPPARVRYSVGDESINTNTVIGTYWSFQGPIQKSLNLTLPQVELTVKNTTESLPSPVQPQVVDSTSIKYDFGVGKNIPVNAIQTNDNTGNIILAKDSEGKFLSRALWLYGENKEQNNGVVDAVEAIQENAFRLSFASAAPTDNLIRYEDIDTSLPPSVYNPDQGIDLVWTLMRQEAQREAAREPLLVSFIYSTILNHPSLESALAFHLSNRLASPAMLSTQIMSLFQEAFSCHFDAEEAGLSTKQLQKKSCTLGKTLRADILAVRDRDPACTCLPDVFLYFKGFHALQTHRVAHYLWKSGRKTLAYFFQSQMAQSFQIDIHPNATIGRGIMLDHGTGVVIGETAVLGDNCSVLHHVTLGGSGKKGNDRHPKIGKGVLLGAGSTVLGNIHVGDGCQIGAGTLVIADLPPHSVAVGVPARIIGKFVNETEVPSRSMDQMLVDGDDSPSSSVEYSI